MASPFTNTRRCLAAGISSLAAVAGCLWLAGSALGAAPAPDAKKEKTPPPAQPTNSAPVEIVFPQSVFIDKPDFGRDPFFPDSSRRRPKSVDPVVANGKSASGTPTAQATQPVVRKDPFANLVLKGMSGPRGRRLVTINNMTFAQGETAFVQTPEGPVRVTCVTILDHSVLVAIDGMSERKELKLPGEL